MTHLEAANGEESVDLEGGIGFDANGDFYVAEEADDNVLRFTGYDADTGTIDAASGYIAVTRDEISADTGGLNIDLEGGIAFVSPRVPGNDTLRGGAGDDTLFGGVGDDLLEGGDDEDDLFGGDGDDTLDGGEDADELTGGAGSDTLFGGTGNDILIGDGGEAPGLFAVSNEPLEQSILQIGLDGSASLAVSQAEIAGAIGGVSYSNDFSVGLAGGTLINANTSQVGVIGGELILSAEGFGGVNNWLKVGGGGFSGDFEASFDLLIDDLGSNGKADGFSFQVGSDVDTGGQAEEPQTSGLALTFDTFFNGGSDVINEIGLWFDGVKFDSSVGVLHTDDFVPVEVEMQGTSVTVKYDGGVLFDAVDVGGTVSDNSDFFFGARTGGFSDKHAIDNVSISAGGNVDLNESGIAVDAAGNLFFTTDATDDSPNEGVLVKRADTGQVEAVALANAGLPDGADPEDLVIGPEGTLYVLDDECNCIFSIENPLGTPVVTELVAAADFEALAGISTVFFDKSLAISPDGGTLFVSSNDTPNALFAVDTATGIPSVLSVDGGFVDLDGFITIAPNGDVIVVDDESDTGGTIYRIDPTDGTTTVFLSEAEVEAAAGTDVDLEGGVDFDVDGNFYVAETNTDSVYKWDVLDRSAGTIDSSSGALFASAAGIATAIGLGGVDLTGDLTFSAPGQADILVGGDGADTLTGGGGGDTFVFEDTLDFGDTITDFTIVEDVLSFDTSATVPLTHGAADTFQQLSAGFSLGADTAFVAFDTTGAPPDLDDTAALADDINLLNGLNAGDQVVFAFADGADARLIYWDDTALSADGLAEAGELSTIADLTGIGTVVGFTAANFATSAGPVEQGPSLDGLVFTDAVDTFDGPPQITNGDDVLVAVGNAEGGDSVDGLDGDDTLTLASGGDNTLSVANVEQIVGGGSEDDITFTTATGGTASVDGGGGSDSVRLADTANTIALSSVEGLDLFENDLLQDITLDGANDITIGSAGGGGSINLNVTGDAEFQAVRFGLNIASNTVVRDVNEITFEDGADHTLTVEDVDTISGGDGEQLVIVGAGDSGLGTSFFGGDGNDTFNGGTGDDTIDGGDGQDFLTGGAGADDIDGGSGAADAAVYTDSAAGVTIDLSASVVIGEGGDAEGDILTGIERLFGSQQNDILTADDSGNFLFGQGGGDTLTGGNGIDAIFGDAGVDILDGGAGNDDLEGGDGADDLTGGLGSDTANYNSLTAVTGVTVDLSLGIGLGGEADGDTLAKIENVRGSIHDDTLIGDDFANTLIGLQGVDIIKGGGGNDLLFGGDDADTFSYASPSDFGTSGDTIFDFDAAEDSFLFDTTGTVPLNRGEFSDTFQTAVSGIQLDDDTVFVAFNEGVTLSTAGFTTAINSLINIGAGSQAIFAFSDGVDGSLQYWDDLGGNIDGIADAGELSTIASINDLVDADLLTAANFATSAGQAVQGPEIVTMTFTPGVDTFGSDDGITTGDDVLIAVGAGSGNDSVDGLGGNDSLFLDNAVNALALTGVETVTGTIGNDTLTLTQGVGDGTLFDLGDGGSDDIILLGTVNNLGVANVEGITGTDGNDALTITETDAGAASIDLKAGVDDLVLLSAVNTFKALTGVETVTGTAGNDDLTFLGSVTSGAFDLSDGDDDVTALGSVTGGVFDLGGGSDSVTLGNPVNTFGVTDVEAVTGTSGNDTLTLSQSVGDGALFDLGDGGGDNIILLSTVNILGVANVEGITGTAGNDALTITETGAGAASIDLGVGNDGLVLLSAVNTFNGLTGAETVTGTAGNDDLTFLGSVTGGAFDLSDGDDDVTALGSVTGGVFDLGGGTDSVTLGAASNSIGVAGVETVTGTTGNDALTLTQGVPDGTLFDLGDGGGDNIFLLGTVNSLGVANVEGITGTAGNDALTITETGAGAASIDLGVGNDGLVLLSAVNTFNGLTGVETVTGTAGNDDLTVTGAISAGSLFDLGDGTDILNLGLAANTIAVANLETVQGTTGNDTLTLSQGVGDGTLFDLGGGISDDIILVSTVNSLGVANVEGITGTAGNDALTITETGAGAASIDLSVGNDGLVLLSAVNTFNGLTGVETVTGTAGNDDLTVAGAISVGSLFDLGDGTDILNLGLAANTIAVVNVETVQGTTGNDTLTFTTAVTGGTTVDLLAGTDTLNLANGDNVLSVSGVETVNGNAGDDTITVTDDTGTNIDGGDGFNRLTGGGGGDTLTGGDDRDFLTGGAGADDLDGGAGTIDTAFYSGSSVGVTIDLSTPTGTGVGGDAEGDTLTGIEFIVGSSQGDTMIGGGGNDIFVSEGGDDILSGGGGDDFFRGGAGADDLTGGLGTDQAEYLSSGVGVTVDLSLGTCLGGEAEGDTLSEIENLTGSSFNDTLIGEVGANTLNGSGGDDVIRGGGGNDLLSGFTGADTFVYASPTDFGTSGDTISDFDATEDGFLFDTTGTVPLNRGNADTFQLAFGGVPLDDDTVFVAFDETVTLSTAGFTAAINSLIDVGAGSQAIFAFSDGANGSLQYWDDLNGDNDGIADAGELSTIASLTGFTDAGLLSAANFATSAGQAVQGPELISLNFTSGVDTFGAADGITTGDDVLIAVGAASGSDSVDGLGGNDTLVLGDLGNTLAVANIENLIGGAGADDITVTGAVVDFDALTANLDFADTVFTGQDFTLSGDTINSGLSTSGTVTLKGANTFNGVVTNELGADMVLQRQFSDPLNVDATFEAGLANAGTIQFNTQSDPSNKTATLTIGAGESLTNSGTVETISNTSGTDSIVGDVINSGTLSANGDDLFITGDVTNSGVLNAGASRTLRVDTGTLTANADTSVTGTGTLALANGADLIVNLDLATAVGITMGSGSVVSSGGGNSLTTSGTSSLSSCNMNVAFVAAGAVTATGMAFADTVNNQSTMTLKGTNTFDGLVTNEGGATMVLQRQFSDPLNVDATFEAGLANAGTIQFNTQSDPSNKTATLTMGAGETLDNSGTIETISSTSGTDSIVGDVLNSGTLSANGDDLIVTGDVTNTGTLDMAASQSLTMDGGTLTANGGTIISGSGTLSLTNGADLTMNLDLTLPGLSMGSGSVISSVGGNDLTTTGTSSLSSADINVGYTTSGTANVAGMTFADTVNNQGTMTLKGTNTFDGLVTNEGAATMVLQRTFSDPLNVDATFDGGLTNVGTIQFNTQSDPQGKTATLTMGAGETLDNSGTIETISNTSGTDGIVGDVLNSGTLSANGDDLFITGDVTNSGILNAEASRTLSISGGAVEFGTGTSLTGGGSISLTGGATLSVTSDIALLAATPTFVYSGTTTLADGGISADFSGLAIATGLDIVGGTGADTITGTASGDTIRGGNGNDVLAGGAGADAFSYASPTDFGTSGDTIADFDAAEDSFLFDTTGTVPLNRGNADTFQLAESGITLDDDAVFVAFNEGVVLSSFGFTTAINSLIDVGAGSQAVFAFSDGVDGSLQYWDDLGGNNDGVADGGELSTIASITGLVDVGLLSAANFATSAGQAIDGPGLISVTFDGSENDFVGTAGDDIFLASGNASATDGVDGDSVSGGAGPTEENTLILADGGNGLTTSNIHLLFGGSGDDAITVTDADGIEAFLGAGSDSLTMTGVGSMNTVVRDVEVFTGSTGDNTVFAETTLTTGMVYDGGTGTDTLNLAGALNVVSAIGFEQINLAVAADTLTLETTVSGTAIEEGGFGELVLLGAGNSVTVSGTVTVTGAAGDDAITVTDATGTNIDGGNGFNILSGGGGDDTLTGGDDRDFLTGGAGADDLDGGAGTNDTAFYSGSSVGVTIDLSTPTGTGVGGDAERDTLTGIEFIVGSEQGDTMIGGGGNDIFLGADGADILSGGGGDDFFRGGAGADDLTGGLGTDEAEYLSSGVGVTVDLSLGTGLGGDAEGDTLSEIENLTGSNQNDTLIGEVGANTLSGFGGDDVIKGLDGNDILIGGTGNDEFFFAEDGDTDTIFGLEVAERIVFEDLLAASITINDSGAGDDSIVAAYGGGDVTVNLNSLSGSSYTVTQESSDVVVTLDP